MGFSIVSDGIMRSGWNGPTNWFNHQELTKQQLMDLQSAKKAVIEKSRKNPGTKFYLNVDDDGEVEVSTEFKKGFSGMCYKNGSEIALPEESHTAEPKQKGKKQSKQTVETENSETMATTKTAPVKKVATKVAAKSAPKTSGKDWGKLVKMSIKDMRTNIKKGFTFRNLQGILLTETILAEKAKQDHVRKVYQSK